ncbi:MAG TPA: amidohydrolase family protein [Candidatus Avipropionibacterium avicola]|uniref:Amidohydrolase family protein n=1 Tax=Candidatus Avipropionibacterium avicola TaxID=2840701 RepID=A0A9D1GXZ6_9ACTN|nr:amidohydrolase family protein [Candidatus Avipropionibacterium avicola]
MSDNILVRDVRPLDLTAATPTDAAPVDLRIRDGIITEIGVGLARGADETALWADGRWALPGLWDRHVHLGQWALSTQRLDLSGTRSSAEVCAVLAEHLSRVPASGTTVQGYGHRTAIWDRQPSVAELDAVTGDVPTVLISGDAHHGWLNSTALRLLGMGPRDGIVEEAEWFELYSRLSELPGVGEPDDHQVRRVLADAVRRGVVGLVDLEFAPNHERWAERMALAGWVETPMPRIEAGIYPVDLDSALATGLATGDPIHPGSDLVRLGPLKIISDGSLSTRTAFCCEPYADGSALSSPYGVCNVTPDELRELLATAVRHRLTVALHAIGDAAVRDAVAAFDEAGATGSIEHAQLIGDAEIAAMARIGLVASVQPAHLLDDVDAMQRCWPDRTDRCFRTHTMVEAGVDVRFGSDAPVARLDPWLAMAAAVHRGATDHPAWHPDEAVDVTTALRCSTNGIDRLAVGGLGDVMVLDENPLSWQGSSAEVAERLAQTEVAATVVSGRLAHAVW